VFYGTNPNSFAFNGGLRPNMSGEPVLVSNSNFDPNANFYLNKAPSHNLLVDIRQRAGLSLHTAAELPERIFWNLQRHKDS